MTLDDFFGDTKKAWEELQKQRAEEAKQKEAQERQRKIDELKARREGKQAPASKPTTVIPTVTSLADYIKLENISCVDADGNEFEKYDVLYVKKDIERNANNSQKNFTSYQGAVYFESQGLFLPSIALSCAILAQLYQRRNDPAVNAVLMHYKNKGDGNGWHPQNTIINYKDRKIIHYPHDVDFSANGGTNIINQSPLQRKELPFVKSQKRTRTLRSPVVTSLNNCALEDGLKNDAITRFFRQYTGLVDPSVLVDIGRYFQKQAYVWFPDMVKQCKETKATGLGCNEDYLSLSANGTLNYSNAARGVRLGAPTGIAPGGSP